MCSSLCIRIATAYVRSLVAIALGAPLYLSFAQQPAPFAARMYVTDTDTAACRPQTLMPTAT